MLKLEDIQEVLKQQKVAVDVIVKVIDKLREVEEDKKVDKQASPKSRNQLVLICFDNNEVLKNQSLTGAVVQIEEGAKPSIVIDRLKAAATQYNNTKKGKRSPAKSIADALNIPRKFTKSELIMIKSKEPLEIVATDNAL